LQWWDLQVVGEENPMNLGLEGFAYARLHIDLDYLPSFSLTLDTGALRWDGLVAVPVEVDLFSSWIVVVPEYDLLGCFTAWPGD
jgi:hypothetical protein